MKVDDYQKQCLRTARVDWCWRDKVLNATLGLGESGELQNVIKKTLFHGHENSKEKVKEELGDIMWSVAVLADLFDLNMSDVCQYNIDKLWKRYPFGFSEEDSVKRADKPRICEYCKIQLGEREECYCSKELVNDTGY